MELAGFSEEMTGLLRLGGGSGVPPVGSLLSSASAFSSLLLHRPQFLSHRNSGENGKAGHRLNSALLLSKMAVSTPNRRTQMRRPVVLLGGEPW